MILEFWWLLLAEKGLGIRFLSGTLQIYLVRVISDRGLKACSSSQDVYLGHWKVPTYWRENQSFHPFWLSFAQSSEFSHLSWSQEESILLVGTGDVQYYSASLQSPCRPYQATPFPYRYCRGYWQTNQILRSWFFYWVYQSTVWTTLVPRTPSEYRDVSW